jgi:hypothetical protein
VVTHLVRGGCSPLRSCRQHEVHHHGVRRGGRALRAPAWPRHAQYVADVRLVQLCDRERYYGKCQRGVVRCKMNNSAWLLLHSRPAFTFAKLHRHHRNNKAVSTT